ncbi:uncharacterized protein LOC134818484 isoform X2 [Bolinopsis microptera]|uniref:uncharacterized protein LOC134818484 isoform X2 n=1 Tax=Bolinopsis microptera TaxID=2820187 RepID=UPI00307A9548
MVTTTPQNKITTNNPDMTTNHPDVVTVSWVSEMLSSAMTEAATTLSTMVTQSASFNPVQVQTEGETVFADDSTLNKSGDYGTTTGTYPTSSWYTSSSTFYTDSYTHLTDEKSYHEAAEIILAVFFIVLTLATIVGNMMALTVFTRIPLSKTVSVIFFTSMAIADLCNGIFVMPFSVYSLLNENRTISGLEGNSTGSTFNEALQSYCTFSGIVMNTSSKAALFTLILICFDRFISVHDALHVHLIMTVKNCLILVITCWVSALLLAIFPYLIPDDAVMDTSENRPFKVINYQYVPQFTQCSYRVEDMFDIFKVGEYVGLYRYVERNVSLVQKNDSYSGDYWEIPGRTPDLVAYPPYVSTAYFFVNILPIVVPTYLIVFFCVAVIVILHRIFKNSKRIIQQIEPPDLKRNRSFRGSVALTKELRSLSFKRKAAEKPITTQMSKVDAGYTEIHTGQGTASEDLEGKVVLRRTSRKIKEVNVNNTRSPNLARDRWSQISVKSLQKRTKADHQKKAINTVILMLMFFVFCYALEWFNIFNGFFLYLGIMNSVLEGMKAAAISYYCTLTTIMKYLNCAGNPFLYYFRMSQFQKEVRGLTQSWNGTTNNKIQTSGRSGRSKKGYVSLVGGKSSSSLKARNKSSSSYKYRPSWSISRGSPPR